MSRTTPVPSGDHRSSRARRRDRFTKAVAGLFSLALVMSVSAIVTPTVSAQQASEGDPVVAQWQNAGWATGGGLVGGPDALGTVLIDWVASADAVTGETFDLQLPRAITGDPRDPAEFDLSDDQGYLGATGVWSQDRDSIEFTLSQDGTVEDDEGEEQLLSGTFEFDVVWADAAKLDAGKQTLTFRGSGLNSGDGAQLTAEYVAPASDDAQPGPTSSPVGPTTSSKAPERESDRSGNSTSPKSTAPGMTQSHRGDRDGRTSTEPRSTDATEAVSAGETAESQAGDDDEGSESGDDESEPAEAEAEAEADAPVSEVAPDRSRQRIVAEQVPAEQLEQISQIESVMGTFSDTALMMAPRTINPGIEVTIPDGVAGFEAIDQTQAPQLWVGKGFWLNGTWDATNANPQPGDEFSVGLPNEVFFDGVSSFDLVGESATEIWGTCSVASRLLVCTLGDQVVGFEEIKGTFRLVARAHQWVKPGDGLDVTINGNSETAVLPGNGGINDGFVQPTFSKSVVSVQDVGQFATTNTSRWGVRVPGPLFTRNQVDGVVTIQGDFAAGTLASSNNLTGSDVVVRYGRSDRTANIQTLTGAVGTFVNVPGGNTYRLEIDVSNVDPALLEGEHYAYFIDYSVTLSNLTSNRFNRSWTLTNGVTLETRTTANRAVAGPSTVTDEYPTEVQKNEGRISISNRYPGMMEIEYTVSVRDMPYYPRSGMTGKIRDTYGSDLQICGTTTPTATAQRLSMRRQTDLGYGQQPVGDGIRITGSGAGWFEFNFDYSFEDPFGQGPLNTVSYNLCLPIKTFMELGPYAYSPDDRRQAVFNRANGSGSSSSSDQNPIKRGAINSVEREVAGKVYAPQTTLDYTVQMGMRLMGNDNITNPDFFYEDRYQSTLALCGPEEMGLVERMGLTYRWYDNMNNKTGSFLNLNDVIALQQTPEGYVQFRFNRSLTEEEKNYISQNATANGGFLAEYTMCTASGGQDAYGTRYLNRMATTTLNFPQVSLEQRNSSGSGTGQGVRYGSVSVTKAMGPDSAPMPAGTMFDVLFQEYAPGVDPITGTPAAEYVRKVEAGGDAVAGVNARGPGWTIKLSEPTLPTIEGVEFTEPVFSGGEGVTVIQDGQAVLVSPIPASNVDVLLTNYTVPLVQPASLSWSKVGGGTADRLAGSEWELTEVDAADQPVGAAVTVTDCVADTAGECAGPDIDPAAGEFEVAELTDGVRYMLVETKAPAGYVLDETPHYVTLASDTALGEIENDQQNPLIIPLTGGTGAQMFLFAGVLLLVAAGAAVAVRSRMQRDQFGLE